MYNCPRLNHETYSQALSAFDGMLSMTDGDRSAGDQDVGAVLANARARYHAGLFRLVMVGEEKRGKSSFVNALLGMPGLLPVGDVPMTSLVYQILYGKKPRYRVFFLPEDPDGSVDASPSILEITAEELESYGTENGNRDNYKRVDFICVELPHPLLSSGLVIVDLPGLGGLKREHGLITRRYLPNTDAAFFVLESVEAAMTREEAATLESLRRYTDHIIFIQTKKDAVGALQWKSWMEKNLQIVEKVLDIDRNNIPYFPVSSLLKSVADRTNSAEDLEASGFQPLFELIDHELLPRKLDLLAEPISIKVVETVRARKRSCQNELNIASTASDEELKAIEQDLRHDQAAYAKWKSEQLPDVLERFNRDFSDAYDEAERAIHRELDPAGHGPVVGPLIEPLEADDSISAERIAQLAPGHIEHAVVSAGDNLSTISEQFDRRIYQAHDNAAQQISDAVLPLVVSRQQESGKLTVSRVRIGVSGGMVDRIVQANSRFMTMGSIGGAITAVVSTVFPPLALAVGVFTVLGSILSARKAYKQTHALQRRAAIEQLRNVMSESVRRVQGQGLSELRSASTRRRRETQDNLTDMVKRRDREERDAIGRAQETQRQTREQRASEVRALREKLAAAERVLATLRKAGVPIDEQAAS